MEHLDTEFREAEAIHLHDQLVVITADAYTYGTDSGYTMSDEPEYPLNLPSDTALEILARITEGYKSRYQPKFAGFVGFARHYQDYPVHPVTLASLKVRIVSDRLVEIKMIVEGDPLNRWLETWTYSGAYTVTWPVEEVVTAESQG